MSRWIRFTAGFTAVLMLWATVLGTGISYAEETPDQEDEAIRTIVGRGSKGWAVVDIRNVSGKLIILSPVVGREIDLKEAVRFSMFQGPSEFNRRALIPVLATSISGFKEAIFLERSNGKRVVRIEFTVANKTRYRTMPLKENEVKRIREYVENYDRIQQGDYKIHRTKTQIEEGAEYPKLTDEVVSFETRVPRFVLARRVNGSLTLKDGEEITGEFVPVFDEGSILIESDFTTHSIPIENIERIRTMGNKSSSAMRGAFRTAFGSAITGALSGAFAAWQSNGDVKDWALFGTIFFGAAGFIMGLARGVSTGHSSEDIVLGPVHKTADDSK